MFKFLGAMSARIFLITVIGVLVTAIIVNFFGQRDFRANESRMREQFAFERIENIIRILDATLPEKRNEIQDVFSRMGSKVVLNAPPPTNNPSLPAELAGLNVLLVPSVADQISTSKDCHPDRPPLPPGEHRPPEALMRLGLFSPFHEMERPKLHHQCLAVYTHLEDSTPVLIHLHFGRRPPLGRPGQDQPLSLMVLFVGLIAITWIVASISTKPLRKMADAALQLAKNIEHPPLAENEGPIEVRNAARAFNVMQRSILKHVEERAFILGAIAHDLQTPLTRLRLRLEKVKDTGLKQQLIDDLTATQEMVKEGLDFARLCSEDIHKTRVDLTALANAVCEDFIEMGHSVKTTLPSEPLYIMGSIHLLKRCLNNLLANAISYAKDPYLQLEQRDSTIYCIISDDGPGIPGNELDSILEPFRRLEDSRSRQTGGTGLGMTIARMIIEKHGGRVSLSNKKSPLTGLIVTIELPH